MEYISRKLEGVCEKDLKSFPILTLTGPRQCGKSTLLRHLLPDWRYVNLEEPSVHDFALQDPKGFINTYSDQVIFDEIQRAPKLLSQLQVEIDKDRRAGRFAVTGSHTFFSLNMFRSHLQAAPLCDIYCLLRSVNYPVPNWFLIVLTRPSLMEVILLSIKIPLRPRPGTTVISDIC